MTNRIHVDDLTKNAFRFAMLDDDTQERLRALEPHEREWWTDGEWVVDGETHMCGRITYRQKPKHDTKVRYHGACDWGIGAGFVTTGEVRLNYPDAISILRIETCIRTGKMLSAKNVEVGDE